MNDPNENVPINEPTYEEYVNEVEVRLAPLIEAIRSSGINKMTAREYLESEEGEMVARNHYEDCLQRFRDGTLSRSIFLGDAASSAAICLSLMYE